MCVACKTVIQFHLNHCTTCSESPHTVAVSIGLFENGEFWENFNSFRFSFRRQPMRNMLIVFSGLVFSIIASFSPAGAKIDQTMLDIAKEVIGELSTHNEMYLLVSCSSMPELKDAIGLSDTQGRKLDAIFAEHLAIAKPVWNRVKQASEKLKLTELDETEKHIWSKQKHDANETLSQMSAKAREDMTAVLRSNQLLELKVLTANSFTFNSACFGPSVRKPHWPSLFAAHFGLSDSERNKLARVTESCWKQFEVDLNAMVDTEIEVIVAKFPPQLRHQYKRMNVGSFELQIGNDDGNAQSALAAGRMELFENKKLLDALQVSETQKKELNELLRSMRSSRESTRLISMRQEIDVIEKESVGGTSDNIQQEMAARESLFNEFAYTLKIEAAKKASAILLPFQNEQLDWMVVRSITNGHTCNFIGGKIYQPLAFAKCAGADKSLLEEINGATEAARKRLNEQIAECDERLFQKVVANGVPKSLQSVFRKVCSGPILSVEQQTLVRRRWHTVSEQD
jgi:hypothetical protein